LKTETINYAISSPRTVASIASDLSELGVTKRMILLVHSSLSSIGWVCGGAVAVILALEDTLGTKGTLVMPTHSGDLSEPSEWRKPPVPQAWWKAIRDNMPAYNSDMTPTREMGVIPEIFRKQPGVLRSNHPCCSFAAWGKHKRTIARCHQLSYSMNSESPLGKVYKLDGSVLLIGVGHDRNTSLHLAEYMSVYEGKSNRHGRCTDCASPSERVDTVL
jgi:aminoglycoside 3-N-acetyltransferase